MSDASGSVHLVFNGEIYNYRALQALIESRGIQLRTKSDTETILGLYQLFGLDCVDHLTGMFSFVLWDSSRRRLVAARDRVGIKPLYVLRTPKTLAFSMPTLLPLPTFSSLGISTCGTCQQVFPTLTNPSAGPS